MTRHFIGLITVLLFMPLISLKGQDNDYRYIEVNGIRYKVLQESDDASTFGTVSVCPAEFGEYSGDIIIPLTVKEFDDAYSDVFKVVAIEDGAFQNTPSVTSIKIPVSVESIGKAAFRGCGASTIDVPLGNLSKIGAHAFSDSKITSANIPSGVKTLGVAAFSNCTELESVTLGENLRSIPDSSFYQCHSLREIVLPNRISRIDNCAFLGCVNLRRVQFNEGIRVIGLRAFADCVSLRELSLPESVLEIGMWAFSRTSIYEFTIPSKVKTLNRELFSGSTVRKINLSSGLTSIDYDSFAWVSTYPISIPENVETHPAAYNGYQGEYNPAEKIAFDQEVTKNIKKAKVINVGDDFKVYGILDIGRYIPFQKYVVSIGGNDYSVIYAPEPGVEYGQLRLLEWSNGQSGAVRVPDIIVVSRDGKEEKYVVTELGSEIFHRYKTKYTWVKDYEYATVDISKKNTDDPTGITSVELGYFIRQSARGPFSGCTAKTIKWTTALVSPGLFAGAAIETFEFPKGTEEIPDVFFSKCKNLKTVTIPSTVKKIGKQAFYETSLTRIDIPEGVEIIGVDAFRDSPNLKTVSLASSLKEIGSGAFNGCSNLQSITLPSSITKIGRSAFYNCGFERFVVPQNINTICEDSYQFFAGCSNLKTIEFAPGTTKIPNTFCVLLKSLETIILPDTVEEIGERAFYQTSIKALSLPKKLKIIGDGAFAETPITSIILPETVQEIGRSAFSGCQFDCVVIPASVTTIGSNAFSGTKKIQLKCPKKALSYNSVSKECFVEVLE